MKKLATSFALPFAAVLLLTMGQAQAREYYHSHHDELVSAARQFEQAATTMDRVLRHVRGKAYAAKSARRLSRAARQYRRDLDHRMSYRDLRGEFANLAAYFHDFRHDYQQTNRAHTRRANKAVQWLADSFRDLHHEVRSAGHQKWKYRWYGKRSNEYQKRRRDGRDIAVIDYAP